jgi:hypothetical protein
MWRRRRPRSRWRCRCSRRSPAISKKGGMRPHECATVVGNSIKSFKIEKNCAIPSNGHGQECARVIFPWSSQFDVAEDLAGLSADGGQQ